MMLYYLRNWIELKETTDNALTIHATKKEKFLREWITEKSRNR